MVTALTVSLPSMPTVRKYRRETTEVSSCLKYMIFGFNVLFWVNIFFNLCCNPKTNQFLAFGFRYSDHRSLGME